MKIEKSTSVGSIVGENFKTANIFESKGIDFCCGGNQTIEVASSEKNVEIEPLITELEQAMQESDPETEYIKRLAFDELIDYIIKRHHNYVKEQIPIITQLLEKIASVHGDQHPEVFTIKDEFSKAANALASHTKNEEEELFPYIKMMVEAQRDEKPFLPIQDLILNDLLNGLLDEHTVEGDRFDDLAKLTNNFAIPADVCNTYFVTFKNIKAFQDDLHRHVHLENNLLFPAALALEKSLLQ